MSGDLHNVPPEVPDDPGRELGSCLAWGGGFVIGFIGAAIVIGAGAGAWLGQLTHGSMAPGVAMLVASIAMIAFAVVQLRQQPVPFLQGALIGGATASVLTGLCGAILMMQK